MKDQQSTNVHLFRHSWDTNVLSWWGFHVGLSTMNVLIDFLTTVLLIYITLLSSIVYNKMVLPIE